MKIKNLLFFFITFILSLYLSAQVNFLWEKRYTSSGFNQDYGRAIALDGNGNVYVTGTAWDNSSNSYNIVTIKYNAAGIQQWIHSYNGTANALDEGRDIAVDASGNVYVTGYVTNSGSSADYILIKLDNNGNVIWTQTYNGSGNGYDEAYALYVDGSGNVYVTGSAYNGSTPNNDAVTLKYNTAGTLQWTASHNGNNGMDAGKDIIVDASGNVYVCGYRFTSGQDLNMLTIKYNSSGTQQWFAQYNSSANQFDVAEKITLDAAGNVYITGYGYGGLLYDNNIITIKYNNGGTLQWVSTYDGQAHEEDNGYDLVVDANQNVYVAGRSFGLNNESQNWLVLRYNPSGTLLWQDIYNGPGNGHDEARSITLSATGKLYVTGYSAGNGTNNDYLTIKYDTTSPAHIWEARFDGPASNSDQAYAMAIDANEYIYVTGTSKDPTSGQDYSTIKWCQFEVDAGTSPSVICVGDSIQLNATSTGGISYSWSPTTGLSNPTIANPWAKPVATTTYVVTSVNAVGCTDIDSVTVIVNSLPNGSIIPSGPTTFCAGDSVILTASPASNYTWLPGNQTTQSITVKNSGTYTLVVTDSNNCSASSQIQITVNPLPNVNAGPDTFVCKGYQIQLNATGAVSYQWNNASTLSANNIPNPYAFPATTTTYVVTGTDANNCMNTDTIVVNVNITPYSLFAITEDTVIISINPSVGFLNLSTNATSRLWDFGDGNTATTLNASHSYTTPGIYTAKLISYNNQCSDTADTTIWVFQYPVGLNLYRFPEEFLHVFPNPASSQIYVSLPFSVTHQKVAISAWNTMGQEIQIAPLYANNSTLILPIESLPQGIYFIRIIHDEHSYFSTFVKE